MAGGDKFLHEVARRGLHSGLRFPAEVIYRQHVLVDCVANPGVVSDLYNLAVEAAEAARSTRPRTPSPSPPIRSRATSEQLRAELAFYLGSLNLRERLIARSQPVCYPGSRGRGSEQVRRRGLYDESLALTLDGPGHRERHNADGRQLDHDHRREPGGKSTFLRSVGQAQVMLQAGMFVPASALAGSVCTGVFTHYKREEDSTMERGKLDEEFDRMSAITDRIKPGGLLLCNESFASTNEREGSQIAREIIRAMTEAGIRVVFVTHLYDLAESIHARSDGRVLFLRAQREPDGGRTYRLPGRTAAHQLRRGPLP